MTAADDRDMLATIITHLIAKRIFPVVPHLTPLPCGSWPSPVTSELVSGKTVSLSMVRTDNGHVFWLERRPSEKGRTVLVCRSPDGRISDVTPPPFDVTSRVHEYGGGAYAVSNGRIVFSVRENNEVWLMSPDTGGSRKPVRLPTRTHERYADFSFSIPMQSILAVQEDHGEAGEARARLVAFPLNGAPAVCLAEGADFYSSPISSPDGSHVAWIEWSHPDMPWDATRLCVGRTCPDRRGYLAGLEDVRVIAGADQAESVTEPRWTGPDTLIALSDRSGRWSPERFDLSAGTRTPLCVPEEEIGQPGWVFGQRSFTPLPDGRVMALAVADGRSRVIVAGPDGCVAPVGLGSPDQCPELLLPSSDQEVFSLEQTRFVWLDAAPDMAQAVVLGTPDVPYRILRSATTLPFGSADISSAVSVHFPVETQYGDDQGQAFFYPPASSSFRVPDGEKPPMIVLVHGGPTARAADAFSFKVQWWTSRGFAVLDVNYGGSTGFGRRWRQRLEGQWGIADVNDCIAATRHVLSLGLADPARVAIRGSSAGGLTVLNALATSDVFAAGTSLYGVTDLRALAQETHKFESRYTDRLIGPWPDAESVYLERSPLTLSSGIRAPVLLLQGLEDRVVPPSQARAMADALKRQGTPFALYEFPGEGHGFRSADVIRRSWLLELNFYGQIFGFAPDGEIEQVRLNI
ncbi:prolyl oligopeptidase family serine peptidase [Acetobacter sp. AN02]|uniref:alpha/beta hydrolase family protein n=1 Tax=Acetobacter sp. AN02 TaxID=2894186 RepID=UPI0024345663|nr:prolyl oligopeptidase family serine peptidase [Acetobacter sp. AN02]MDG6095510.1 prolyl oligopeptidase family serine peptidase [Acetobacter sp. AN02]